MDCNDWILPAKHRWKAVIFSKCYLLSKHGNFTSLNLKSRKILEVWILDSDCLKFYQVECRPTLNTKKPHKIAYIIKLLSFGPADEFLCKPFVKKKKNPIVLSYCWSFQFTLCLLVFMSETRCVQTLYVVRMKKKTNKKTKTCYSFSVAQNLSFSVWSQREASQATAIHLWKSVRHVFCHRGLMHR